MRTQLEFQAGRIETVLSLHKVLARVTGSTVTPRWVRFQVLPAIGAKVSRIKNLHEEMAQALNAPSCRISRHGAAITIEVPRDDPQPVHLLPLYKQVTHPLADPPYPPTAALLGLAEDDTPLLIRLPSPDVGHILILGEKDAGKTTLLRSIAISLMLTGSPGKIAFVFLGNAVPLAESAKRLGFLAEGFATPKWSAVIPMAVQAADKQVIVIADDVFIHDDAPVAAMARMLDRENWHFILAWDGVPPAKVTNLFKVKLVGRVLNIKDAQAATDLRSTGAERLLGKGDFLALAEGRVDRFQAAYITPAEIQEITNSNSRPRLHS